MKRSGAFCPIQRNATIFGIRSNSSPLMRIETSSCRSAGGIRETYERFHNTNFGLSPDDPDGYLLQRYLFHVDLHAGERFRFFGELNSSLEDGRTGGPRPLDEDKLDVHQGFLEFVLLKPRENSSLTLRIGRHEMAFGSGRMVDLREGPNVPLSFDGLRLSWKSPAWHFDAFATRPVQNEPGTFDDPPQHDFAEGEATFPDSVPEHRLFLLALNHNAGN